MHTGELTSTNGTLVFDLQSGEVDKSQSTYYNEELENIHVIDVQEWQEKYPHEQLCGSHDILDFGYWTDDGEYEEPAHDWREMREDMRKEDLQEKFNREPELEGPID